MSVARVSIASLCHTVSFVFAALKQPNYRKSTVEQDNRCTKMSKVLIIDIIVLILILIVQKRVPVLLYSRVDYPCTSFVSKVHVQYKYSITITIIAYNCTSSCQGAVAIESVWLTIYLLYLVVDSSTGPHSVLARGTL